MCGQAAGGWAAGGRAGGERETERGAGETEREGQGVRGTGHPAVVGGVGVGEQSCEEVL
jgi:hypothetical protein